ncbi:hypothetical protein QN277_019109 [Acacia crassicarpa]|uniref:DUF4283 domain-containing protein n=1 Tax=Acacia crassicarpa TaxID=499986 RepID=A0AAE1JSP2_9FABA|nr:hypothetical protein QN277_019109 [Acacia crassicarpa]
MEVGLVSEANKQKQVVLRLSQNHETKKRALVGKILTQKNLNYSTVVSMISKAWQVDDGVEILDLDRSNLIFLFRFNRSKDFTRILKGRPWNILGHLLNLQVWEDDMILQEVNFDTAPFWLQFHGLPVDAFDSSNAKTLGDAAGESVMFENPMVDGKMHRTFIRVQSLIRLDKPLAVGFWVPRVAKDPIWVNIQYEQLQKFCYKCGCLVHNGNRCKEENLAASSADKCDYGLWLSARGVRSFEDVMVTCKDGWPETPNLDASSQSGSSRGKMKAGEEMKAVEGSLRDSLSTLPVSNSSPAVKSTKQMAHGDGRESNGSYGTTVTVPTALAVTSPTPWPKADGEMVTSEGHDDVSGLTGMNVFKEGREDDMESGSGGAKMKLNLAGPHIGLAVQTMVEMEGVGPCETSFGLGLHPKEKLDIVGGDLGPWELSGPSLNHYNELGEELSKEEDVVAAGPRLALGNVIVRMYQHMEAGSSTGPMVASPLFKKDSNSLKDLESPYTVDFPSDDESKSQAIIPFNGRSPISEITAGIHRINLKRPFQDENDSYSSSKCRRLICGSGEESHKNKGPVGRSMRGRRRSFRAVKNLLRQSNVHNAGRAPGTYTPTIEFDFSDSLLCASSESQNTGGWMEPTTGAP